MTALALALMLGLSQAHAQSEVTGTLSSGTASGSTATGTISGGSGNSISGTVVGGTTECSDGIDNDADGTIDMQDPACDLPTQDDESDDPGSAGGNNRSSNNDDDDDGDVAGDQTGPTDGVGGGGDVFTPGVPNTGAGGDALLNLVALIGSLAAVGGGAYYLRRKAV